MSKVGSVAGLPPVVSDGALRKSRDSGGNLRTSLVEAAIASVVYPVRSSGLIDILSEPKPPLPVDLPPIPRLRVTSPQSQATGRKAAKSQTSDVPTIDGDNAPNPFTYPKNVEQFIEMLDQFKAEDKEKQQNVPTLMKGTKGFKQSQTILARIKPFLQPTFKPSLAQDYKKVVWRAQHGLNINHLQKVSRKTEYIQQRKEIYYLRRAVRARKIAMELLKKNKEFEEACLSKYEWLTDFTKEAFEDFLRENDELTQKAAKRAEATLKEKLDKSQEVRQLSININQLKSDIVGTSESLKECRSYMRFLNDIAREIRKKDEEEEIRAQVREQQVKEELVEFMKQGMTLREAKKAVLLKADPFYEEEPAKDEVVPALDEEDDEEEEGDQEEEETAEKAPQRLSTSESGTFLAHLGKSVRRDIGLPDDYTDPPPEPEPKGQRARKEFRRLKRLAKLAPPTPTQIAGSLVTRTPERLMHVTAPHEKAVFGLELPRKESIAAVQAKLNEEGEEDEDGYNENALLRSLELVAGNEKTDRRELANLSFTKPSQLLAIYSDMEEANLSLIQHSQASEELLEKVQVEISKTRKQLNHRGKLLRDEISTMQASIDLDEERAKALGMLFEMFTGGNYDVRKQQKLYRILQKHITKVYQAAVGSVDEHLNPTMMLTSVEKNFEDLMKEILAMPIEVVLQISRELDKERRELERVEQINKKKAMYEDRKSRSIARAEAPIVKKKGRPLLPRSRPPKTIIKLSQAELESKAKEDEFNYFFGP